MEYQPGDIFFTRQPGNWISDAIVKTSTLPEESPALVSHTGIILAKGLAYESLSRVAITPLDRYFQGKHNLYVFDCELDKKQRQKIVQAALDKRGKGYDWLQLAGLWISLKTGWNWPAKYIQAPYVDVCHQRVIALYSKAGIKLEGNSPWGLFLHLQYVKQWKWKKLAEYKVVK